MTATADTVSATLPIALSLCQTNPGTGTWLSPAAASVATLINANATPTFGIFVGVSGTVADSPGTNHVFVRFRDSAGTLRGATSVAVRTR
jgi:hypothetical protein